MLDIENININKVLQVFKLSQFLNFLIYQFTKIMSEQFDSQHQQFLELNQQLQAELIEFYNLLQEDQLKCIQLNEQYHAVLFKYHEVKRIRQEELKNFNTLKHNKILQLHKLEKRAENQFFSKENIRRIALQDQLDYILPHVNIDLREIQESANIQACVEAYKTDYEMEKSDLEYDITKLKIVIKLTSQDIKESKSKSKKSQRIKRQTTTQNETV